MKYAFENYEKSAKFLMEKGFVNCDCAIILGTGLHGLSQVLEHAIKIPYEEIPGFVKPTFHDGHLCLGDFFGKKLLVMSGRYHYYEGYDYTDVTYPIRVMKLLGIKKLIVTNAAGAINKSFNVGDLMLITDHIKFFNESPARGKNLEQFGPRFFDMSDLYSKAWRASLKALAKENGIDLMEGVYAYMPGPQFETPAEIKGLRFFGADAVGMSTVPEAIEAKHCGLTVLGISCMGNMAAGVIDQEIYNEDVTKMANMIGDKFIKLIKLAL